MMEEVESHMEAPMVASGPVEMAAWEQDKENIRPARAGRNAAKLAEAVLSQSVRDRHSSEGHSFAEARRLEREDFESRLALLAEALAASAQGQHELSGSNLDSLVQLWSDYARWASEWYPSDSQEERCVLERATTFLAEKNIACGDLRHLRLWLRLADLVKEPQDIFNFLWARTIGVEHVAFYESWAASLERQLRFSEAEEVLQIGRARRAQPFDRLTALSAALTARMHQRVLRTAQEDEGLGIQEHLVSASHQRPALNLLTTSEAQSLTRPSDRRITQASSLGLEPAVPVGLLVQPINCLSEALAGDPRRASIFDARSTWSLPPAKECVASKENAGARASMAQPVPARRPRRNPERQHGQGGGPDEAGLSIFVDEELREQDFSPPARRIRTSGSASEEMPQSKAAAFAPQSVQRSDTPPSHSRPSGATPLPAARPPPGAPNRDSRRRRPAADLADDLVAGLSSLTLGNLPPPAKRARGVGLMAFGEGPARLPLQEDVRSAAADTVVMACEETMYCETDVAPRSVATAMDTTDLLCTPPRPQSLRTALFGDSSGRGPPPVASPRSSQGDTSFSVSFVDMGSQSRGDNASRSSGNARGSASSCGMGSMGQPRNQGYKKKGLLGHPGFGTGCPTIEGALTSSTRLLVFEDSP